MKPTIKPIYHRFSALGGPCSLCFEVKSATKGGEIAQEAESMLRHFEAQYSRYVPDSVISRINKAAGTGRKIELDAQAQGMMNYAVVANQQSGGLFDITSGVLRRAWDFKSATVPEQATIDELLPLVGMQHVEWEAPFVHLSKTGMEIDFGGFGKEFAADMLCAQLRNKGVRHGYVELAGDIAIIGPASGDSPWPIGISNPLAPENAIASVPLASGALATSGTYQRSITVNGSRYSHILNPKTGWPIKTYASVSVISDSCLVAGSLSTIAMLKAAPLGHNWLDEMGVAYLAVEDTGTAHGSIDTASTATNTKTDN